MKDLQESHREVTLDPNRQYAVIYEWIKGMDAAEARKEGILEEHQMHRLTERAARELAEKGFIVRDNKPHHVILRPSKSRRPVSDRNGQTLYALVDFDLLESTPEHERRVKAARRSGYLKKQAKRFETDKQFPPDLHPVEIFGVSYVYGRVESTGGVLWVVGKDPELFEYFLPEKWRESPKQNLSEHGRTYDTRTKDNVHVVCRVSKVGRVPDVDVLDRDGVKKISHGYNNPFEEIALSFDLNRRGIPTVYPRAVYMSGHRRDEEQEGPTDRRRFRSHRHLVTPEGHPVLSLQHRYVTIWGYWNGPDEYLAEKDEEYYKSIDALRAYRRGIIDQKIYEACIKKTARRLSGAGVQALNLKGSHILLSLDRLGKLVSDDDGLPLIHVCNLELMGRIGEGAKKY